MTDQNNNNKNNDNNELNKLDNLVPNEDQIKETVPNSNNDLEIVVTREDPNITLEYSKKLQIGDTKLLIVDKEEDVVSGEAPSCCVVGSPEHVGQLKFKVDVA